MTALHKISCGLYVLTTKTNKMNGCIINTVMQVTSTPNKISITVNKNNETTKMINKSGEFVVSILDKTTKFDIIERFGFTSGKNTDKFKDFKSYELTSNNLPYLTIGTCGYIVAKVVDTVDVGTHLTFIAEVIEDKVLSENEELTYAYYHKHIKPKTATTKAVWVCRICGYVHDSDNLPDDFICPICKHGKSDFYRQEVQPATKKSPATSNKNRKNQYYCPKCGCFMDRICYKFNKKRPVITLVVLNFMLSINYANYNMHKQPQPVHHRK